MSLIDRLTAEEGTKCHMYLDTANPPVVTTGIGHAMFSVDDAVALPWNTPREVVMKDYAAILHQVPGYNANYYAQFTASRLQRDFVLELLQADIDKNLRMFRKLFPEYDTFPPSAKEAISDLAFNLGGSFPKRWPLFSSAVRERDWLCAAEECIRSGVSQRRNQATRDAFVMAAQEERNA